MKFIRAIFFYLPLKKNIFIHFLEKVGEAMAVSKFLLAEAANVFSLLLRLNLLALVRGC
jgi:hypothetical protein